MEHAKPKVIEIVIPSRKANLFSFLLFLLCNIVFGGVFILLTDFPSFFASWKNFLTDYAVLIAALIGGMALHEFMHAITWAAFCERGIKSVQFGVNWRHLAPYVHCKEYIRYLPFMVGLLLPGIALGIVPAVISLFIKSGWLMCFGVFFTAGAAGDFLAAFRLIFFDNLVRVMDHPDHIGFFVERP